MEEFEHSGIWWLPENPEKQISGTLKYNPREGANLMLVGSFKEEKDFNIFIQPKIILGTTSNGKYITLYKCFETKFNMSFPGLLNSAFLISVIIIGCHFAEEEDITFSSLSLSTAEVQVHVLPLLQGKLKISKFRVNGLAVMLIENKAGNVNWAFQIPAESESETSAKPEAPAEEGPMELTSDSLVLTRLVLEDISVDFRRPEMDEPLQFKIEECTGTMLPGKPLVLSCRASC